MSRGERGVPRLVFQISRPFGSRTIASPVSPTRACTVKRAKTVSSKSPRMTRRTMPSASRIGSARMVRNVPSAMAGWAFTRPPRVAAANHSAAGSASVGDASEPASLRPLTSTTCTDSSGRFPAQVRIEVADPAAVEVAGDCRELLTALLVAHIDAARHLPGHRREGVARLGVQVVAALRTRRTESSAASGRNASTTPATRRTEKRPKTSPGGNGPAIGHRVYGERAGEPPHAGPGGRGSGSRPRPVACRAMESLSATRRTAPPEPARRLAGVDPRPSGRSSP